MSGDMTEELEFSQTSIDKVITQLGGCGRFQFVVTFFVSWVKVVSAMSMVVMVFGNYDPGWTCADTNSTVADYNSTFRKNESVNDTTACILFDYCNNITFTQGMSTVVSEWQLVCSRSWISSLIISIQMVGVLVGSYLSGFLGDRFGRKRTLYAATFYHLIVNVIAMFSNSWQMFAVVRFFIGIGISLTMYLPNVLALEYVTEKWRNAILCFPLWSIGCLILTLSAMLTEDWRYLHGVIAVACLISLLPFYWMPESLRWLVVKDRMPNALAVVESMAKMNGTTKHSAWALQQTANRSRIQSHSHTYSCTSLLRKGMRFTTFAIGVTAILLIVIYYAITFSVKSLAGNLYVNLFIMFASEIPLTLVSSSIPNYIGRKLSVILFSILTTLNLVIIVGLDVGSQGSIKSTGILVNALLARLVVDAAWDIMLTYVGELVPTVNRSTGIAYANWIARIGGILAPYLIVNDPSTLYINYSIMAAGAFICCSLIVFLPETRGKPLKDTWEVSVSDDSEKSAPPETKHMMCT